RGETKKIVDLPMSRNDIGDYLGLTVETVSRTFTRLRKTGLIELRGAHHVALLDHDALLELAGIDTNELLAAEAAGF
ncbi:MAG: helix-turn-helix domain-containing protein, partial [Alphaproteobacteria bacterium]